MRNVGVAARDQFLISEAVALSVAETVAEFLKGTACTEAVSVKWPNDVYVGERKICGMLIEHSLSDHRQEYTAKVRQFTAKYIK